MARRIARARPRLAGRRRPGGTWARVVGDFTNVPAATKVLLTTFSLSNPGIGETVRRVLGSIYVQSDQSAASEHQRGAFGLIVANDLAIAAGAASIPGPFTDADDDGWFVWRGFTQDLVVLTGVGFRSNFSIEYPFDSKAMRRIEEGFGVAVMAENADATDGLQMALTLSVYATRN